MTIQVTATTEEQAKAYRREQIEMGEPVSLIAFDPSRELYVFDVWPENGVFCTRNAKLADALIREHIGCSVIDTQSQTFGCYSHGGEYIGISWIG